MKRYRFLCLLGVLLLTGCNSNHHQGSSSNTQSTSIEEQINHQKYGVFLGCDSSSVNKIKNYENIMIDLDEFSSNDIVALKQNNSSIYAYLSVGSLENYRSYYSEFRDITFMDYDNWPNERWVDVSNPLWQSHILSEANRLKDLGADGIFMDNFDVYYIASEEYEGSDINKEDIYRGCLKMLNDLSSTGLKLVINSGTDFLERMYDENKLELKKIDVYAQETVFSKIDDYDDNVFSKQTNEEKQYYLSIINFMKNISDVLLIEYTKDETLKEEIVEYCEQNNFSYYISNNVELKI